MMLRWSAMATGAPTLPERVALVQAPLTARAGGGLSLLIISYVFFLV